MEHIKALVESERSKKFLTYDEFLFQLKRWWCNHYKRPYKDPLLDSYTFEELFYEYWDVTLPSREESEEQEKDPKEVPQQEYDWAAEEEAKELLEQQNKDKVAAKPENDNILEENDSISDAEWADKYLKDNSLVNPTNDEVDSGGDITASFEV